MNPSKLSFSDSQSSKSFTDSTKIDRSDTTKSNSKNKKSIGEISFSDRIKSGNFDFISGLEIEYLNERLCEIENNEKDFYEKALNSIFIYLLNSSETFIDFHYQNNQRSQILIWMIREKKDFCYLNLPYFKITGDNIIHFAANKLNLNLLYFFEQMIFSPHEFAVALTEKNKLGRTPLLVAAWSAKDLYEKKREDLSHPFIIHIKKKLSIFANWNKDFLKSFEEQMSSLLDILARVDNQWAYQIVYT